jgi:curved DNA-binding protein CbpA
VKLSERDVLALASRLDRMDYYKLLRVERTALIPEIRPAYHRMRRGFDPDHYLNRASELRRAVERIAERLSEAYVVLRVPARRKAYDEGLERGQLRYTPEEEKEARSQTLTKSGVSTQGRHLYGQAIDAERRRDFKAAVEAMKLALTFEPKNQYFRAKLEELEQARKRSA